MTKLVLSIFTIAALGSTLASTNVLAADACEISMDRTPCAGKETEARKPYGGKNPTSEKSKAKTAEDCLKDAEKQVKIVRKGTLSKKVATVSFEGKDLGTKEDSAACK